MSSNESEMMETNEMDDTETKYFQDVNLYEETPDQSSGSLQGSLSIPSFNLESANLREIDRYQMMEQSRLNVDMSALALQGSQGFQTLDQTVIDHQWQTTVSDSEHFIPMVSGEQAVAMGLFGPREPNLQTSTEKSALAGINSSIVKATDNFVLVNPVPSDFLMGVPNAVLSSYKNRTDLVNPTLPDQATTGNNNEPAYVEMVSAASATDCVPQDIKSPKRRQKKSRSSSTSHQTPELQTQKSDSGRPSVSPNRGEHSSAEGQGSSELGFKPSLLEEILTEKKLALLRSPDVVQFLQSQQEENIRQKQVHHGQDAEKT